MTYTNELLLALNIAFQSIMCILIYQKLQGIAND